MIQALTVLVVLLAASSLAFAEELTPAERELLEKAEVFEVFAAPAEYRGQQRPANPDLVEELGVWRRVAVGPEDRKRILETLVPRRRAPGEPSRPPSFRDQPYAGPYDGIHARRGDAAIRISFGPETRIVSEKDRYPGRALALDGARIVRVLREVGDRLDVRRHEGATVEEWIRRLEARDERAVLALVAVVKSETRPASVTLAFEALAKAGPRAAPAVAALASLVEARYRLKDTCAVLAAIGPAAAPAVPALAARLRDHLEPDRHPHANPGYLEAQRRVPPLAALAAIGSPAFAAIPEIDALTGDRHEQIAAHARYTLHAVAGADPVGALVRKLGNPDERLAAASALGDLGPRAKASAAALAEFAATAGHVGVIARVSQARVLGDVARAKDLLVEAMESGVLRPLDVIERLGRIGNDHGQVLAKLLGHGDPAVRAEAARALGDLGPHAREAVPALEEALARERDPLVRSLLDFALLVARRSARESD